MKCWICKCYALGRGFLDLRFEVGDARRYPMDWVFCSQRCQDAFRVLYRNRCHGLTGEPIMNRTELERATRRACLTAFGQAAETIGFDKPLGAYSEDEALAVIDAIVSRYSLAMVEHHEATRYPPVHGIQHPVSDPFADLDDPIPF